VNGFFGKSIKNLKFSNFFRARALIFIIFRFIMGAFENRRGRRPSRPKFPKGACKMKKIAKIWIITAVLSLLAALFAVRREALASLAEADAAEEAAAPLPKEDAGRVL
jgi:hypothetical protein